jgi:hypothetical protein
MLARSPFKLVLLLILVLVSMGALVACEGGAKDFNLEIRGGALTLTPAVLRVEQYREVLLNMKTDEIGTLRIEKLEIEAKLDPARTVPIKFNASRVGRFDLTWQGQEDSAAATVGSLDVRPAQ